jgi:hypothetical protein
MMEEIQVSKDKGQIQAEAVGTEDFLSGVGEHTGIDTNAPVGAPTADEAAAEAKDTRTWAINGTEVSKSEFIRDQFTNHNKSRKAISDEFAINYRTVYGATVNMVNEAEPATRGRSASATKIHVTADNHVVTSIKDEHGNEIVHVDNVAVSDADAATLETTEVDRNTWIKSQVEAGVERGKIAGALGLSYGVIYSMTKEVDGNKQRHDMDWEGETVSRSEYIRRLHATGVSRSDIAHQLNVDYPVVWSALKGLKSEEAKYADAVDKLAKFEEGVEDVASFKALIEMLKAVVLKPEPVEPAATEVAAADTQEATK